MFGGRVVVRFQGRKRLKYFAKLRQSSKYLKRATKAVLCQLETSMESNVLKSFGFQVAIGD